MSEHICAVLEGMSVVLDMLHEAQATRTYKWTEQQAETFLQAGFACLNAHAALRHDANAEGLPLWPLKPKAHQFHHLLLEVKATLHVPRWCFSDEDLNGRLVKVHRSVRRLGAGGLAANGVFKWRLRLHEMNHA